MDSMMGPLDLPPGLAGLPEVRSRIDAECARLGVDPIKLDGSIRFGTPEWVHACQSLPKELGGRPKLPASGFVFSSLVEERHKYDLYGASFGPAGSPAAQGLAVVGGRHVSLYVARGAPGFELQLRQTYKDYDEKEMFYCCRWTEDYNTGEPLLAMAGLRGLIKVLNTSRGSYVGVLRGHGGAVNDLQVHPADPSLMLSASQDESVRLWNLMTGQLVAMFAGQAGHRDDVLALSVHPAGRCFASAGMDNSVKLWALDSPEVVGAISRSYYKHARSEGAHTPLHEQLPAFSTDDVHADYADSVVFLGSMIASKSTSNDVVLWTPDAGSAAHSAGVSLLEGSPSDLTSAVRESDRAGGDSDTSDESSLASDKGPGETKIYSATGNDLPGGLDEAYNAFADFRAAGRQQAQALTSGGITVVQQLHCKDLDIWYLRMAAAPDASVLAAGTSKGAVAVWRPRDVGSILTRSYTGELHRDGDGRKSSGRSASVLQCDGLRLASTANGASRDANGNDTGAGALSSSRGAARRKGGQPSSSGAGGSSSSLSSSARGAGISSERRVASSSAAATFSGPDRSRPSGPRHRRPWQVLTHPRSRDLPVRYVAISSDGRTLVAACDKGILVRYDMAAEEAGGAEDGQGPASAASLASGHPGQGPKPTGYASKNVVVPPGATGLRLQCWSRAIAAASKLPAVAAALQQYSQLYRPPSTAATGSGAAPHASLYAPASGADMVAELG